MSRFKAFAVLVALVVASLAVGVARPAEAGTSLPNGFGGVAVDDLHHHVFVSSPVASAVTVLDYAGKVVTTISDVAGAGSILIDGTTLYVVLTAEGVVEAYDTTTYLRIGRYGEGVLVQPGPLAMAGGKLWTSTGQCGQWGTKLASIDLTPTHAVQVYDNTPLMLTYCIGLADVPHSGDQLLAYDDGLTPASTFRLDLSSGAPVPAVEQRHEELGNLRQLALTPDGQKFVAASGYPYEIDEYRMSDQLPDGVVYATGDYPNAVAVTGARGGLMAAGRSASTSTDIDVFVLGKPAKRVFSYDFGRPDNTLTERSLAFSGDGRLLFAVNGDSYTQTYQFTVFDLTQPPPPTTTTTTQPSVPSTTTTTTRSSPTTTTTRPPAPPAPPVPGPVDPGAAPGSITDRQGDVTDRDGRPVSEPRADLVSAGASLRDGRVVLEMQVAQPTSPLTDPNWAEGASYAAWGIDNNQDGSVDRLAILLSSGGVIRGAVTDVNHPPTVLCQASTSYYQGTLSMNFDPGCIGGNRFNWGALLTYNQGGPGADGPYAVDFAPDASFTGDITTAAAGSGGYWLLSSGGDVYPFGSAANYGRETVAAADIEPTPTSAGYWILGRDGRVHGKGDAVALGDAVLTLGEHAVSLSATPSGRGYWILTDQGRVFAFGDAPFRGDMAGVRLNGPVLGSVATPSGQGYWMVASDGGIFAFGDATFNGSMGGRRLNRPVMSMAPDPDGTGYWLVASDGGIFAFDAPFYGSTGSMRLNKPISGMVPGRAGYLMVAQDGGIFTFGNVGFHGSLGGNPPPQPIVAVALAK